MLIDGLIALLTTDERGAAVYALVADRVYENALPREYRFPAIVIHQSSGGQDYDMAGPLNVDADEIQFDCYGTTALQARALKTAVRSLLSPFVGELPDGTVTCLCQNVRDMAMPYQPNADAKGITHRWILGYSITTTE